MFTKKRLIVSLIVILYAWTWAGGWFSHAIQLRDHAESSYRRAELRIQEQERALAEAGEKVSGWARAHKAGPYSGVSWCLPILPGVFLADSYYSVGPLHGRGGVKIVLYYGFGSTELCWLWGWIA